MTVQDLIDYYVNLLIIQYNNKPNARATIDAFVKQAVADLIEIQVRDGFDMDTAIGYQLDVLGKYVDVRRTINGLDIARDYFALPPYGDPNADDYVGFAIYGGTIPTGFFRLYSDVNSSYAMKDNEMRDLIKLKVRQHKSDHSLQDIDDIMDEFFGADVTITDNGDMTVTYAFTPGLTYNLPIIAVYTNALPKPAGVRLIITGI
jgi:hypothetical protein